MKDGIDHGFPSAIVTVGHRELVKVGQQSRGLDHLGLRSFSRRVFCIVAQLGFMRQIGRIGRIGQISWIGQIGRIGRISWICLIGRMGQIGRISRMCRIGQGYRAR